MHSLIQWLSAYRHRSAIAAAALAGMPLLMMFSAALVVTATLRGDLRDGLIVSGGATLVLALVQLLVQGQPMMALANAVVVWIPALIFAAVLLKTRSMSLCLQLITLFGTVALALFWFGIGDPVVWWQPVIEELYLPVLREAMPNVDPAALVPAIARFMSGAVIAGWYLTIALGLLAGRWFQALLDRPGAFGEEYRAHKQGRVVGVFAAIVFVVAGLSNNLFLQNLVLVLLVAFLLQGIALAHWLVKVRNLSVGWLVMTYVILVLGVPWSILLLASAGFVDNWLDVRSAPPSAV